MGYVAKKSTFLSFEIATVYVCLFLISATQFARASDSLTFAGLVQTLNTGGSITLSSPSGMVVDSSGNIYVTDTGNSRIVEVDANGNTSVLTISGLSSSLVSPTGIAIDGSGSLYVTDADPSNSRVVKITSAGSGSVIGTGGVVLSSPKGVAIDPSGNIFIADTGNNQIVEVTSGGSASALSISGLSSPGTLNTPIGVAVDVFGNLYIADSVNNRIVKVAAGGSVGSVVNIANGVSLSTPTGVAVDALGNLFIADKGNNRIAEVDRAGNGAVQLALTNATVTLNEPFGVAVDVFGTVYVADTGKSRGLIVYPWLSMDAADTHFYGSSLDKSAVGFGHVQLGASTGVTLILPFTSGSVSLGNVKVFTSGVENLDFQSGHDTTCDNTTAAGTSCSVEVIFLPKAPGLRTGAVVLYDSGQNPILTLPLYGFGDAPVAALAPNVGTIISTGGVPLSFPFQIALDGAGNIYDANDGGNLVKIPAGGGSATVVSPGSLTFGSEVTGVAIDGAGNLFISDHTNSRIIVLRPGGVASVLSISGLGSTGLNHPTALAVDGAGKLYISDWSNGRVVEVSSLIVTGSTSTGIGSVIGTGSYITASQAITGVAVDSMGNIYIPDGYNGIDPSRIIKVTAAGVVSLLTPTGITFSLPRGVTVDGMGNIYVADAGHNRIVEITAAGVASVLTVSGLPTPTALLGSPFGVTVDPFGNLYIPDLDNNRIVFVNVSGSALTFPSTARGATSAAKTATVTNMGNQPLVFSTNPTYTADFSNNSGDTNPCTSSTSLSAGTNCDVSVLFTPQSVASLSAGIVVTDNTLNVAGGTQQVSVSGTSFSPGDTTSTTVAISPTSLVRGQTATIIATVSDQTHTSTTPPGSVTFTDTVGLTIITLNNGSSVSLSGGHATLTGVVLSGIGTHSIVANYAGVSGTYLASSSATAATATLAKASVTLTGPTTQPVAVTNGQTGSATVTVTAPYTTIAAPSGTISYSILDASSTPIATGTPVLTAGSTSSTATIPIPGTLAAGSYTINVTYSGDGNYLASSSATTIQLQIGQITPTISWNPSTVSITYGTTLVGVLDAASANGSTTIPGTFVYTATSSGGSASAVNSASVLTGGSYTLTATFTPTDTTTYKSTSATISFTVSQATPSITLTSSMNPALVTNPITLTVSVASTAGTPTGSVSFYDGTTLLATATLSSGTAAYTTLSLTIATHSITAIYSGDSSFISVTSFAVAELVQDFSLTAGSSGGSSGGPTQTVFPGGNATYSLALVPANNSTALPVPIVMSVSGLPPGATATVSPQTIPANTLIPNITLVVQLPSSTASLNQKPALSRRLPPMLWSILLLPFAGKLRGAGKRLGKTISLLLLLMAGIAATVGLSGCGSTGGFFGQKQQTYTVTITATAGTLSRSTSVTLTVE